MRGDGSGTVFSVVFVSASRAIQALNVIRNNDVAAAMITAQLDPGGACCRGACMHWSNAAERLFRHWTTAGLCPQPSIRN